MTPNGEAEGPRDHVGQATRAHTVFQRPRSQRDYASRTPPALVRGHITSSATVRAEHGVRKISRQIRVQRAPKALNKEGVGVAPLQDSALAIVGARS